MRAGTYPFGDRRLPVIVGMRRAQPAECAETAAAALGGRRVCAGLPATGASLRVMGPAVQIGPLYSPGHTRDAQAAGPGCLSSGRAGEFSPGL